VEATNTTINYDDFAKLDLRVATVLECKPHANADKLLVLQIELGNGEKRQICAGLRAFYQPEQLVGKQIIVVANLAPRTMRGEISQGMLLAASDPTTSRVIVVTPSEPVAVGAKVS
jgi:methionine--tRNA ligase beta chain